MRVFVPHGSKDWADLSMWGEHSDTITQGAIIMHDQEPFFVESCQAFKDTLSSNPQRLSSKWAKERYKTLNLSQLNDLSPIDTISLFYRSAEVPIFCHSEKNSKDIEELKKHMFIPCYYWWHGMVARDWFRHWERHADLKPRNKSDSRYRFLFYCRSTDGTRTYREEIKQALSIDSVLGSKENTSPELSATIDVADANTSAIHIVAETLFDTEKIYLTEKVFKPMAMCQPFILFAAPGSLNYLRSYGFKTFDSVWNEEYDAVTDHTQRKQLVIELVRNLESLSEFEFRLLYEKTLPIIEHNQKWFFSSQFQEVLWKELADNMSAALLQQEQLKETLPGGTNFYFYNHHVENYSMLLDESVTAIRSLVNCKAVKKDWVLRRYPVFRDLL